ncbi:hypothetical protein [Richelia intracellularis]|uniref:hypothetical protein n=1 Tax=Richelia intracellularis TaxID=1164990 RepID=UPI0018C8C331|nr:hypothetical protein [Richelia intracellularis]
MLGLRNNRLGKIAHYWRISKEINIEYQKSLQIKPPFFLINIAPWLGILTGISLAYSIWLLWQIAYAMKCLNIRWIYYDDWGYIWGCILIGFSIGILVRINFLFPNTEFDTLQNEEKLLNYYINPALLPADSARINLVGTLLGHQGLGNLIGQDIILHTNLCLIKLQYIPWFSGSNYPQNLIGRQVVVKGWVRRGAIPWIEICSLETQTGRIMKIPHVFIHLVIAVISTAWGADLLLAI